MTIHSESDWPLGWFTLTKGVGRSMMSMWLFFAVLVRGTNTFLELRLRLAEIMEKPRQLSLFRCIECSCKKPCFLTHAFQMRDKGLIFMGK